ncbi:tRNA lysidine(34) synthetase TilS [uncultured Sneathiella sp.]|uniref:tRNA lysidine(34) synthetase TilS n=1 Tax=uncultured Sneathiella sp. TaxID=879315 RepID=UPI0030EBD7CF|tara:strand:+ start:31932 stop:33275 length:1344 start_codon:yes stop_codon:yes gene_type:complete
MPDEMTASGLPHHFAHLMQELLPDGAPPAGFAVAVSGGSDSMALALLSAGWAAKTGIPLIALSVDHGLRPTSGAEAERVQRWLTVRGIETKLLKWDGPYPKTGIQEAAREARYRLMQDYCARHGIGVLLLGHQLEDQLETLLMRLSKGSGLEGLAAMQRKSSAGRLSLLRPLLSVRRETLRAYLRAEKQDWIDDPSNENPVFTRTRVGAVLTEMQQLPGSDLDSIALSLARLQRASQSLDDLARQKIEESCEISPLGFIRLSQAALDDCPDELALRILNALIRSVGGGQRIRLQALEQLYVRLFRDKAGKSATLAGAQLQASGSDWLVCREPGRAGLAEMEITPEEREWIWDNRFLVTDRAPDSPRSASLRIAALGTDGARQLREHLDEKDLPRIPAKVRASLPALWSGAEVVAAPLLVAGKSDCFPLNHRFSMKFRAFYWIPGSIL